MSQRVRSWLLLTKSISKTFNAFARAKKLFPPSALGARLCSLFSSAVASGQSYNPALCAYSLTKCIYRLHIGGNHVDWRHLPPAKTSAHPSPLQGIFITSICYSQRVIHHESLPPDRTPALPSSILSSTCKTLIDVSSS